MSYGDVGFSEGDTPKCVRAAPRRYETCGCKFLNRHVLATELCEQSSGIAWRRHCKRVKSGLLSVTEAAFGACSSSHDAKAMATSSKLTFALAGPACTFRFGHSAAKPTVHTETWAGSCSSSVKSSASSDPSAFTLLKHRSLPALEGYCLTTHLLKLKVRSPIRNPKNSARLAALCLLAAIYRPGDASAAQLPLATFAQLAASCAPHVAVETLAAVARTESGFDTLALHDNTTGRTYHPATREDAIASGVELATVGRHSVDVGLMQVNSANLARMGLTLADAFDPCRNLAAADRVLVDGYTAPVPGQDPQPAVRQALSRYNTGNASRGVSNGYVARVQASAELVVPALRLRSEAASDQPGPLGGGAPVTAQPLPPPPASWDVYGQAKASHGQGAVVFGASPLLAPVPAAVAPPAPVQAPAAPLPGEPVPLRRLPNVEAMNNAR